MSNEARHTPGPWNVESFTWPVKLANLPHGCESAYVCVFGTACEVARCGVYVGHAAQRESDNGLPFRESEAEANARLIASAPDLLAALKAAAERMEAVAEGIPVHNRSKGVSQAAHVLHMAGHLAQHAKLARAAIAKATD